MQQSIPYTNTKPKRPATGHAHAACYAAELKDCSESISREHYISATVLEQLGKTFLVTSPERGWEAKELTTKALASKMLCERHNHTLSGLDAVAGKFFGALRAADDHVRGSGGVDAFNGTDVERWLLKLLCGYLTLGKESVPELWLRILFGYNDVVPPCGMHMNVAIGDDFNSRPGTIEVDTARRPADGAPTGCRVTLHGYRFFLGLDGKRQYDVSDLGKQSVLRPGAIIWKNTASGTAYRLEMQWSVTAGDTITVSVTPTT